MPSRSLRRATLAAVAAVCAFAASLSPAGAQELPDPLDQVAGVVEDLLGTSGGSAQSAHERTEPVYSYLDAIRERVFVQSDFDSDADGVPDTIGMDIIRPLETETAGLKAPVIMDASPYYTTVCRGNEAECKEDIDGDGRLEKFPLFYDNYFVPRGYAVMLLDMVGTASSDGCPTTGGTPDNRSAVMAIDWLNGRRAGQDAAGNPVVADWHNGKTGMIGKSYDGTLANAAAAVGVEGLATIVPISAISTWYYYTRMQGIVHRGNSYPSSLANTVTDADRRSYCAPVRNDMAADDGDEHGDMSPFWDERDYLKDVGNVGETSVFLIHGLQDDNVRTDHFADWWYLLSERDVPRKLWLTGTGHVDPFDFRRAEWVDTIHRWFDHWLMGIENGIMDEPMVDIEVAADTWETHEDWPLPGTEMLDLHLRPGSSETVSGILALSRGTQEAATSFSDATISESNAMNNPTAVTTNRRVFLSEPLEAPVRLSGTPVVDLVASADQADTNLGAIIVDYGTKTQISRSGDGITTGMAETCWGDSPTDDACYREASKVITTSTQWRVHRGVLDALNRDSLREPSPLVPGEPDDFTWNLLPNDYTFPAGHQIGVIVVGNYSGFGPTSTNATITLDLLRSKVSLPVVGGYAGAAPSRGFLDENPPEVTVPGDIVVEAEAGGTVVEYEATVSDPEDPAPTVSCDPPSGSRFSAGTTTVTCTGRDGFGNETQASFTVTVVPWTFEGFFSPVRNAPEQNRVTAGSAIPIKFRIGDRGPDVLAGGSPAARTIDCTTTQPLTGFQPTSTPGHSDLHYDAAQDQYVYVWKTDPLWTGSCRELVVTLADGSEHVALFAFRT